MGSKLFVGNLSYSTTETDLRAAFEQDGRVVDRISIPLDRETGRPRGFAFVEMQSESDAQAAIEAVNGQELDGRRLRVDEAQERAPRPSGGAHFAGGGGGGFDGGGGGGRGGGGRDRDRGRGRGRGRGQDRDDERW